jgi:two-component system, NarL family, sensor kinase
MRTGSPTELHAKLLALCEAFRASGHIACNALLDARHTCFDEQVGEVIYGTVRELLTNVLRHAHATRVEISSVRRRDGSIGIVVADNGIGLPPHRRRGNPPDETGGMGLWSIDRQLRDLDAMLDVEAAPGKGTRAMIILPAHLVIGD